MKGEKMGTNKNENKGKKKERREINISGLGSLTEDLS